jgi:uncharacterized protein (DUF736 family)
MTEFDNTDRGVLFKNNRKENDKHPDYTGTLNVKGHEYEISAWIKTSAKGTKFMSLSIKEPYQKAGGSAPASRNDPDDEIPF